MEEGQEDREVLEEPREQGWQSVIREQCRGDEASCQELVLSVWGRQVVTKERVPGDSVRWPWAVPRAHGQQRAPSSPGASWGADAKGMRMGAAYGGRGWGCRWLCSSSRK